MAKLHILSGKREGEVVDLFAGPQRIGNVKKNEIQIRDPWVSWEHALIVYENGQFAIEDLGSTNGTYVNKQKIEARTALPDGAIIYLGTTKMRFEAGEPVAMPAPAGAAAGGALSGTMAGGQTAGAVAGAGSGAGGATLPYSGPGLAPAVAAPAPAQLAAAVASATSALQARFEEKQVELDRARVQIAEAERGRATVQKLLEVKESEL